MRVVKRHMCASGRSVRTVYPVQSETDNAASSHQTLSGGWHSHIGTDSWYPGETTQSTGLQMSCKTFDSGRLNQQKPHEIATILWTCRTGQSATFLVCRRAAVHLHNLWCMLAIHGTHCIHCMSARSIRTGSHQWVLQTRSQRVRCQEKGVKQKKSTHRVWRALLWRIWQRVQELSTFYRGVQSWFPLGWSLTSPFWPLKKPPWQPDTPKTMKKNAGEQLDPVKTYCRKA